MQGKGNPSKPGDKSRRAQSADLIYLSQLTPVRDVAKTEFIVLRTLIAKALSSGGTRESIMTTKWDISGNCTDPFTREVFARPYKKRGNSSKFHEGSPDKEHSLRLFVSTRCRKCDKCRKARAALWRIRAKAETSQAKRTWFCTLTLSPESQMAMLSRARDKAARQRLDFDALSYREQFVRIHNAVNPEITKMIKRLRKNTGAPFKYLIVAEAHKSGLPHYHALIHEQSIWRPLRYDDLKKEWKLGFTKFNLVNDVRQATYLCKYLSKSMAARVRASLRYGEQSELDVLTTKDIQYIREPMTPHKKGVGKIGKVFPPYKPPF